MYKYNSLIISSLFLVLLVLPVTISYAEEYDWDESNDYFIEKVIIALQEGNEDELLNQDFGLKQAVDFDLEYVGIDPEIKIENIVNGDMVPFSSIMDDILFNFMYLLDLKNDGETDFALVELIYKGSARLKDFFLFKRNDCGEFEYLKYTDARSLIRDYYFLDNDKVYALDFAILEKYTRVCALKYIDGKFYKIAEIEIMRGEEIYQLEINKNDSLFKKIKTLSNQLLSDFGEK
ncbi:hypothetical protein QA601_11235 [Chitinispirillales bacterium ANBcel5]|uniref:hypothetical protein n=1 Tax=Cellulosispirillum alkaliphilum TaxID=3039283 RepID=UPI002A564B8F|nr:hypothetical protein [Chitinispirillales bacterium ANBcel5]